MKKLLITGSNGFVGSYFIKKYKDIKTFSFLKDDCSFSSLVHQMGGASCEE